jgi:hypothetical protein
MISEVILSAIEILKTRLGGLDIELLSDEMCSNNEMGVKIKITIPNTNYNVRVFLTYQMSEDIIWGQTIADEFIHLSFRNIFYSIMRDKKIDDITNE